VEEVTNSVNNYWHQEQTFHQMPYTVHSYGQLMKTVWDWIRFCYRQYSLATPFYAISVILCNGWDYWRN